jgi:hypothetical protein
LYPREQHRSRCCITLTARVRIIGRIAAMAPSAQALERDLVGHAKPAFIPLRGFRAAWQRIVEYARVCARYHAAARLYEELRGLSDAELQRRGLCRDTIAREICAGFDRSARG